MNATTTTVRPEHLDGARMRALQASARVCARVGGHRLGRFHREQTGTKLLRMTSAVCRDCNGRAECTVGAFGTPYHANSYSGAVVLYRCPAIESNRCELRNDGPSGPVACARPYVTTWRNTNGPASDAPVRACDEHTRALSRARCGVYVQVSGPTDY